VPEEACQVIASRYCIIDGERFLRRPEAGSERVVSGSDVLVGGGPSRPDVVFRW